MSRAKPSYAEIALEMFESVEHADDRQRRLKSTTFWHEFRVKRKTQQVVDRVDRILKDQGLSVSVKSGDVFGKEKHDDWIVLNIWPPIPEGPKTQIMPPLEWFDKMKNKEFGSEREVEYFFILPILEKLGYDESEVAIGYSITQYRGSRRIETEADIVAFNGPKKDKDDVLLVVEAKKAKKGITGITSDAIGEAGDYAQSLFPEFYVITNGQKILVFRFNGGKIPDEKVMDFERHLLVEMWEDLYKYVSKQATLKAKETTINKFGNQSTKSATN